MKKVEYAPEELIEAKEFVSEYKGKSGVSWGSEQEVILYHRWWKEVAAPALENIMIWNKNETNED